jgi:hypothetical protein
MPLTRGQPLGYDNERMVFKFRMLNGDETVECQISGAAMDDVAGGKGTLPADREAQFLRLRERIEHIASTIFEENTVLKGGVLRHIDTHRWPVFPRRIARLEWRTIHGEFWSDNLFTIGSVWFWELAMTVGNRHIPPPRLR